MSQHDYTALSKIFESYLAEHQPKGNPDSLYKPMRYINDLGGKRIRPVLLLMVYSLWFDDVTPALPAALAIEYLHNFSLMHDDIMDEAPLRRGRQTVHTVFGKNSAILSGDAMLINCFDLLVSLDNRYRLPSSVSQVMTRIAMEICEGQQMDMDFEQMDSPTEEAYIEMIRKKTACLIGASLRIGALTAGASADIANKLYAAGENIGLAFQIQDDILDVFGEAHVTGKQQGGDILRGKKNYLYVRTYNSLAEDQRQEFTKSYLAASARERIDDVIALYREQKIGDYAGDMQRHYFDQAIIYLDNLTTLNTTQIKSFVMNLMNRDH